jgi:hypothetical protein
LEVLALKAPFRNCYSFWESAFRIKSRGRDDCAAHFGENRA